MKEIITKLERLLITGNHIISESTELEFSYKKSKEKWSKKEILGHLVDSAINNLQRFTEVQFEIKPYEVKKYNQNALVISNNYQNSCLNELTQCWIVINTRILIVLKNLTEEMWNYKVIIDGKEIRNLKFLIEDYIEHLEHHLNQLIKG